MVKKKLEIDDLKNLVSEIKDKKITGVNVTVPFKKAIIPFLDKLSTEAEKTQSVNTVFIKDNKIFGHNTDIIGFINAIKKINFSVSNKRVFLLGAGGVVPSLVFALNQMNAAKIYISNRTLKKAKDLKILFPNIEIIDWGNLVASDLLINATSIGLNKEDKIDLDFSKIGTNKFFYDVIYNPKETNFLKTGKQLGNLTENGKLMFIYQALSAFNLWHNSNMGLEENVIELLDK